MNIQKANIVCNHFWKIASHVGMDVLPKTEPLLFLLVTYMYIYLFLSLFQVLLIVPLRFGT